MRVKTQPKDLPRTEAASSQDLSAPLAAAPREVGAMREVPEGRAASARALVGPGPDAPARDLAVFNRMLRGEVPVEEGMRLVAHSGGWPIRTAQGFIFARPAGGDLALSLAGEHDGWRPEPMKLENGLFWHHATIGRDAVSPYKLVDPKGEFRADPWARAFAYDRFGEYSLTRAPARPHLERWPMVTDGVVEPRSLRVFVPAEKPTHFLFAHDGQNLFDPGAPHGGWRLHESTGPSTLVIGIDNTEGRRTEYTHTKDFVRGEWVGGGAEAYAKFVEETVRPFIQARYGKPRRVALIGSSLGGLVSVYGAIKYAEAYDFVASMSGTMGWGSHAPEGERGPTIAELMQKRPRTKTIFYLDSGGEPGGKDNYDSNRATADALAGLGYAWDRDLFHWHERGAVHNEAAWAARVRRPLEIFEQLD